MREYNGAFVAFDVAKAKHTVAVAEAGRSGEVRCLGAVENTPACPATPPMRRAVVSCTVPLSK